MPDKLASLNTILNNGNEEVDYQTMKRLLSKLNVSKFCFLKHNEEEAKSFWKMLKDNKSDQYVSLSKLQSLVASPLSKEEIKSSIFSSNSACEEKVINQPPISLSNLSKPNTNYFEMKFVKN